MAPSPRWFATTCCSCGSGRSASSASYLLARELGLRWIGAAVTAAAFAYADYRVTEAGHFQVISSGGLALGMFLLLRGYRRDSRKLVLAGWLVSAWQVSLGFTLGLQYTYLLLVLALLVLVHWWFGRLTPGRPGSLASSAPGASATPSRLRARAQRDRQTEPRPHRRAGAPRVAR